MAFPLLFLIFRVLSCGGGCLSDVPPFFEVLYD